jgi:hypothetical protein
MQPISILPVSYEVPSAGGADFMAMAKQDAPIKFVIIKPILTGYEYWTPDKVCHRSMTPFKATPDIKPGERPKHFWFCCVWDMTSESVKFLRITQNGIQQSIAEEINGTDCNFAELLTVVKVTATGSGERVKYNTSFFGITEAARDKFMAIAQESSAYKEDLEKVAFPAPTGPWAAPHVNPSALM